ncbi:hypothetical protein [Nonomuraea cypriaca]|nr:hypothetical protein [Nonomuraea cypriaca]
MTGFYKLVPTSEAMARIDWEAVIASLLAATAVGWSRAGTKCW